MLKKFAYQRYSIRTIFGTDIQRLNKIASVNTVKIQVGFNCRDENKESYINFQLSSMSIDYCKLLRHKNSWFTNKCYDSTLTYDKIATSISLLIVIASHYCNFENYFQLRGNIYSNQTKTLILEVLHICLFWHQ